MTGGENVEIASTLAIHSKKLTSQRQIWWYGLTCVRNMRWVLLCHCYFFSNRIYKVTLHRARHNQSVIDRHLARLKHGPLGLPFERFGRILHDVI